jgi:hypothetical protein
MPLLTNLNPLQADVTVPDPKGLISLLRQILEDAA